MIGWRKSIRSDKTVAIMIAAVGNGYPAAATAGLATSTASFP